MSHDCSGTFVLGVQDFVYDVWWSILRRASAQGMH